MIRYITLLLLFITGPLFSQSSASPGVSDIEIRLQKLNFLGSVLYVAAHPDDENTQLIAYLVNQRYARTGYLSMTRGDGGQNLVGPEIREALGVIRTQELLAARRIDGGLQFFTRANDFGYSKNAEETLRIWNEDEVLSDVVRTYRKFKPDVIITRFPPDSRAGHGHHTSSAILAQKAFDLSGDKNTYPEQLNQLSVWQPVRLFTNTGRWWNPNMTGDEKGVITVDVGAYNPIIGRSMTEIAAQSRSQHRSQGFGSSGSRGHDPEYLEFVKGKPASKNLFDGIDTTWNRVKGGMPIGKLVTGIIDNFDPLHPSESLGGLLDVRKLISGLDDPFWKKIKLREVDELIREVTGLYLEATSDDWRVSPGEKLNVTIEIINRNTPVMHIKSIAIGEKDSVLTQELSNNTDWNMTVKAAIPADKQFSQPYWLRKPNTLGMYKVDDPSQIGKPENDPPLVIQVTVGIENQSVEYTIPVEYKWNDPVKGEQTRPLVIGPPATVNIAEDVYLFEPGQKKNIQVSVRNYSSRGVEKKVSLEVPDGWKVSPSFQEVHEMAPNDIRLLTFELTSPSSEQEGSIKAKVEVNRHLYTQSQQVISYDNFPIQVLMPEASARIINADIKKKGQIVGYLDGAGDAIPATLREIGYKVTMLSASDMTLSQLNQLDAIVLGVRALNTNEDVARSMPLLLKYVNNGGTLVVQYNTSQRLITNDFAPYPIEISHDRVTDENAPVKILAPDHPVLNSPNKITQKDFKGWVQERGLYFPDKWDDHYTAILASHDPDEKDLKGGLLITKYGKGYFVYTGYSWFRELPAGVPGAIRLFANMVSLGENSATIGQAK